MTRGTTPTHSFVLPFAADMIEECSIAYSQKGQTRLIKRTEDCILEENIVSTKLSQQETLGFDECVYVEIQLKVKLKGSEEVLATDIFKKAVKDILDVEEL